MIAHLRHGLLHIVAFVLMTALPAAADPVYDKAYIGAMGVHKASYEDTFIRIARDYNLGFVALRAANPDIDPWMPGEGTEIILPARHLLPDAPRRGVVINLADMRLYAYVEPGKPPVSHPIGVGRDGLDTPMGRTSVVRKTIGPTWRPTPRMRSEDPSLPEAIGPGPDNPLGTHALYLGWPSYLIHGTNKPYGIGRRVSSGCIRMYPEDIVRFYDLIDVGTPVTVVNQPVKAAWIDDALYLQAHPSLEQADKIEQNGGLPSYVMSDDDMRVIMRAAGDYADHLDWRIIRQAIRERHGIPVEIARKPAKEAKDLSAKEPVDEQPS